MKDWMKHVIFWGLMIMVIIAVNRLNKDLGRLEVCKSSLQHEANLVAENKGLRSQLHYMIELNVSKAEEIDELNTRLDELTERVAELEVENQKDEVADDCDPADMCCVEIDQMCCVEDAYDQEDDNDGHGESEDDESSPTCTEDPCPA